MLNIVIPMAGQGQRFLDYGFKINKYLLPIDKNLTPMIVKAVDTLNATGRFIFIIREENGRDENLRHLLSTHFPISIILSVDKLTEGPASTCYIAKNYINNDEPLIISNSDQILDYDFKDFIETCQQYDGCVMTYTPDYPIIPGSKDKHSFIKMENGVGTQVEEKIAISEDALVGTHYYKRGSDFVKAYQYIVKNNIRAPNGEFYISNTYQAMINQGYKIGKYPLSQDEHFYPVGEPKDYFKYYNQVCPIKHSTDLVHFFDGEITLSDSIVFLSERIFSTGKSYTLTGKGVYIKGFDIPFCEIDPSQYTRGWFIGNFEPALLKRQDIEVGYLKHRQGEKWPFHYHKNADEINILVKGSMIINEIPISHIFIFEKNTISCPIFLQDCEIICIKTISDKNDKYLL
jgi:dTDP-glucose pyrophosphorylase